MLYSNYIKNILLTLAICTFVFVCAFAEVPQVINYQGRLTDSMGDPVADDLYLIRFTIWDHPTLDDPGNELWSCDYQEIATVNGLFTYQLGSSEQLPDDLFVGDTSCYLGIKVGTDPEISPRTRMVSSAFSYQALRADTAGYALNIPANSVGSDEIADGGIKPGDIAVGAVGSAEIANGTILPEDISFTAVDVSSTQTITGTKTFENLNISTTTRRLSISHVAFIPQNNTTAYELTGSGIKNTTPYVSNYYYAPVSLPDGAVVTQVEGTFYDNDPSYLGTITMDRVDPANAWSIMTTSATGAASGLITLEMNSISYATIDNENYTYMIVVVLRYSDDSNNMIFGGAEIEYTITRPLP